MKTWIAAICLMLGGPLGAEPDPREELDNARQLAYDDPGKAAEAYRALLEKHGKDPDIAADARIGLAGCLESLEKWSEAMEAYDSFVRDYPDHYEAERARACRDIVGAGRRSFAHLESRDAGERALRRSRPDLTLKDVPLEEIVGRIRDVTPLDIFVDRAGGLDARKASLVTGGKTLKEILPAFAAEQKLEIVNRFGVLVLASPERADALRRRRLLTLTKEQAEADPRLESNLARMRLSLRMQGKPFEELIAFLHEVTMLDFDLAKDLPAFDVIFCVDSLPLEVALDLIGFLYDVEFALNGKGGIQVSPRR